MSRQGLPLMDVLVCLLPSLVGRLAELHVELMDLALHQRLLVDCRNVDGVDLRLHLLDLILEPVESEVLLLESNELVNLFIVHSLELLSPLLLQLHFHLQLEYPMLWILKHLLLQLLKEAKGECSPSHRGGLGLYIEQNG